MDRTQLDHPTRSVHSIEDLAKTLADATSLPSPASSFESVSIDLPFDDDDDGRPIAPCIAERRRGKKLPSLDARDVVQIGMSLETAKITEGPTIFRKPKIVVNARRVPAVGVTEPTEGGAPGECPSRVRRVSDVIDSLGDSAPSSPRTPAAQPNENGVPKSVMSFLPDWHEKSAPPPVTKKVADRTDSAPMGKHDDYDAVPILDDDEGKKHVYATMPVGRHSPEYNMEHPRRGRAIVFNHDLFDQGYEARPGSDVDAKTLEKTFTALGFEVAVHHNLEHSEIKTVINALKAEDHSDADCLVVVILSHGIQGGYVLSKDVAYPVDYLWHSFKADVCPTLAGKPKMFFIQACRGDKLDKGVHMMRSPLARTQVDSAASEYKIPSFADFLIAYSTVDGHYAWRNPEEGTWFVQCLCVELTENGSNVDLLRLMTRTARRVALDHESFNDQRPWDSEMKQVPSITSMLIRDVYFRPKTSGGDGTMDET